MADYKIWDYQLGLAAFIATTEAPVQIEGYLAGRPFYFRARGQYWSLGVGTGPYARNEVDIDSNAENGERYWEGRFGTEQYGASYMPIDVAESFVRKCASGLVEELGCKPPWWHGVWGTLFGKYLDATHPDDRKRLRKLSPKHLLFQVCDETEEYLVLSHPSGTYRVGWFDFWPESVPALNYGDRVDVEGKSGRIARLNWHSPRSEVLYFVETEDGQKHKVFESDLAEQLPLSRDKPRMRVSLYEQAGLSLIIEAPVGTVYRNPTGGASCSHPQQEGVLVPLRNKVEPPPSHKLISAENELRDYFASLSHEGTGAISGLSEDDGRFVNDVLERWNAKWVRVDWVRLHESHEAWIYVHVYPERDVKEDNGSLLFEGVPSYPARGVLTWCNSG